MMSPRVRRPALVVHLAVSIGWLGALVAYLALDVTASTGDDAPTLRAAYIAMDRITQWAIIPLASATVATGLLMALGTKWGLVRHYWVIISLVATLFAYVVLLIESRTVAALAAKAADAATSDDAVRDLPGTLLHSIGGTVVLGVVLALNVYKPRGLTPYGWRRQQYDDAPPGPDPFRGEPRP